MERIDYPRWLHHQTLDPVIARNAEDGARLFTLGYDLQPPPYVPPGFEPAPYVPPGFEPAAEVFTQVVETGKNKPGRPRR